MPSLEVDVLDQRIAQYLLGVHQAETCLGLEAKHRARRRGLPDIRTIYRWRRLLDSRLAYFPMFSLEALGLVQLHLFITRPDLSWARLPYAIESLWVTENHLEPILYLHCLVPLAHLTHVEQFVRRLPLPHAGLFLLWSGSSWQRLQLGTHDGLTQEFPVHAWPARCGGRVPQHLALAIPVIGESWNRRIGFLNIWRRMQQRLGRRVRAYIARRKVYWHTNGSRHVTTAYRALVNDGLFRQYALRYRTERTVLVAAPTYERTLPSDVRPATRVAELSPTKDGGAFWRLQGTSDLVEAGPSFDAKRVYWVESRPSPEVHFRYDLLFDPTGCRWHFSTRQLRRAMQVHA